MKSSSNLDHAKVKGKYRRPLFDIPDEPRVDGVVKPERKRSKIDEPGPSRDGETNAGVARPIKETLTVATARLETGGNKTGLKQLAGNSNYSSEDQVNSDNFLNVKRKRFNKGISKSHDDKTYYDRKDILDDKLLQLPAVEKINYPSTKKRVETQHVNDVDMSSQDSFTDLFASSATNSPGNRLQSSNPNSSQVALSQNAGGDPFSNFDDDDDFKLAELDMSGIISSYNSACTEIKNQERQSDTCCQLGVKIHEETSNKIHEKENDDIKDSKIPVKNIADKAIQQVNSDANTAANINTGHISNEIKNECETKDANVELFYGLPPHVGSLIKKHKGIEKLYGKLLLLKHSLIFS